MSVDEIVDGLDERTSAGTHDDIDWMSYKTYTDVISRITRTIMLLLIYLIVILVPLIISLEIIYICFPVIREKMDEFIIKVEGKGIAHKALGFSLKDAKKAVEVAATIKTGRSALYYYTVNKVKSIMFLAYILAWVLLGATDLIDMVVRLTSGLFEIVIGAD